MRNVNLEEVHGCQMPIAHVHKRCTARQRISQRQNAHCHANNAAAVDARASRHGVRVLQ